jgi:hypothetical protein
MATKKSFAATMEDAWKEACNTYLTESGLEKDSEEWKFIMETKESSQIIQVINATWANYNNPVAAADSAGHVSSPQFVTSSSPAAKKDGLKARVKHGFNKMLGRKESGKILRQPEQSTTVNQPSYMERLQFEQKVSGKPSKVRDATEAGLQLTEAVEAMNGSESIKTVVDCVLKFSNGLQPLVTLSDTVNPPKVPSNIEVGSIRLVSPRFNPILFSSLRPCYTPAYC